MQAQTSSSLVYMNGGSLVYTPYANKGQSNAVNIIPNFSHAGYMKGGVALPDIPVVKTISPIMGDNTQSIQNAINYVEALPLNSNGYRGAVLLKAGCYDVQGQLNIESSGVVLRGEGQGGDGTVLHANKLMQHTFLTIGNPSATLLTINGSTTQRISTPYVPVGTYSFDVANASGFSIGNLVSVKKTVNQKWIDDLGMGQTQLCGSDIPPDCVGWTPSGYQLVYERTIVNISGNTITLNVPIVDAMETLYGGGEISKTTVSGRISNCGVENLRIESAYASDIDEDHGWTAIQIRRSLNCWVKKVTAQYFGFGAVTIQDSNFNTIEECAMIDYKSIITGGRRYGFNINGGMGNLFQRCYTREGRHDYVTSSRVEGPNVFLDCYSDNTYSDIGPHHRWATGLLFDNIRGGEINVRNRGNSGSGHGWAGAQTLFWNLKSYKGKITVESPIGARNWGIGCVGTSQVGDGYWESWNSNVTPRSLYLQQLQDRLGTQAVDNIAIQEQKTGNIYNLLAAWAGEGELIPTVKVVTAATLPAYEGFDYAADCAKLINNNSQTGKPHWFESVILPTGDALISTSPIWTATGLPAPTGNALFIQGAGSDPEFVFTQSANDTYASFLLKITNLTAMDINPDYFATFGYINSLGSLTRNCNVLLRLSANNLGYNLGINNGVAGGAISWDSTVFNVNEELFIVIKKTSSGDCFLFINPTTNTSEPSPTLSGGNKSVRPTRIIFNQVSNTSTPAMVIDELRVAETWEEVLGRPAPLGVSELKIKDTSIYPNPVTNGELFISSENNLQKDIIIYSLLGIKVFEKNNVSNPIKVSQLAKGWYILKIIQGNTIVETKKFIIQ